MTGQDGVGGGDDYLPRRVSDGGRGCTGERTDVTRGLASSIIAALRTEDYRHGFPSPSSSGSSLFSIVLSVPACGIAFGN